MGKSWNIPGFDVYDPSLVLYAPFWRPDMVARGGAIKNGTGTMNVSPQALAVGANTITVTAAGTLVVNMPEGGTVASGTMTVTGSPVTVSAGIATTITTTGATGNITCTPSNIIRSKDRNNHAITIVGGLWNYQGLGVDGDDYITVPAASTQLNFTSGDFSMVIVVKVTSLAVNRYLICRGFLNADGYYWGVGNLGQSYFVTNQASAYQGTTSTAGDIVINNWYSLGMSRVGASVKLYKNGVELTSAAPGTHINPTTSARAARIGIYDDLATNPMIGTIGEVLVYSRALSVAEFQQIYLATKWRYQ